MLAGRRLGRSFGGEPLVGRRPGLEPPGHRGGRRDGTRSCGGTSLLETTRDPVDLVRRAIGYTDPAAFRRVFKEATGLSPASYRDAYGLRNGPAQLNAARHRGPVQVPASRNPSGTAAVSPVAKFRR